MFATLASCGGVTFESRKRLRVSPDVVGPEVFSVETPLVIGTVLVTFVVLPAAKGM